MHTEYQDFFLLPPDKNTSKYKKLNYYLSLQAKLKKEKKSNQRHKSMEHVQDLSLLVLPVVILTVHY